MSDVLQDEGALFAFFIENSCELSYHNKKHLSDFGTLFQGPQWI
jgi:hypothetical protein